MTTSLDKTALEEWMLQAKERQWSLMISVLPPLQLASPQPLSAASQVPPETCMIESCMCNPKSDKELQRRAAYLQFN